MSWGSERARCGGARRERRPAYPAVLILLAATLLAGCGDGSRRGVPEFHSPQASTTAGDGTVPATDGTGPGTAGSPGPTAPATATPPPATTAGKNLRYVFPVRGNVSYHPTHAVYPGTDIFADCGTPVVAVTDGRILEVSRVDRYSKSGPQGPYNGGRSVSLLADDGVRYYGSHLTEVAAGIEAGVRVRAGQQLGTVGRTGNANNVCHLHFGISPPCSGRDDWWIRRGVVSPAPFLDAWRKKTNRSPVATVTAWHREHGCPKAP